MNKSVKKSLVILGFAVVVIVISYSKLSVMDKVFVQLLLSPEEHAEDRLKESTKKQQENLALIQATSLNSLSVCPNYLINIDNIPKWQEKKKAKIQNYFQQMYKQNIPSEMIDLISEFTAIGFFRGRLLSHKKTNKQWRNFVDWLAEKDAQRMTKEESGEFNKLLDSQDIGGVKTALLTKKISTQKYLLRNGRTQTPIAHILNKFPNQGADIVNELVVKGEKPSFSDILMATELALPVSLVSLMVDNSTIDPTRVFYKRGVYNSLTMVAIDAQSPDLVEYWLSLGSPAIPDYFLKSALDNLKLPNDVDKKNVALDIFNILMKYNVKPIDKATIKKLLAWLPKDSIEKNKAIFTDLGKAPMLKKWQAPVIKISAALFDIVLKDLVKKPSKDEFNNPCFPIEGRRLLNFALKSAEKQKNDHFDFKIKENSYFNYNDEAQNLLAQYDFDVITINEAIEMLKQSEDLAAKLAINILENQQLKELYKNQKIKQFEAVNDKIINDIYQSSENDDWQVINEKVNELLKNEDLNIGAEQKQVSLTMKLMAALSTNQPFNIIKSLLEQGATLPDNAMMFLVKSDSNINNVDSLFSYGLNINVRDSLGRNMIYYSVQSRTVGMLKFLINHGVLVNELNHGLDPLDIALSKIEFYDMFSIIRVLITSGSIIKQSHKQRVLNLSMIKPSIYKQLVSEYPEFIN